MDDEIFKLFICDASTNSADLLAADFDLDFAGMVDEDTVSARGEVEGNTFVGLFGRCAAVLIPDANCLTCLLLGIQIDMKLTPVRTVLRKCTKLLPKSPEHLPR